MSVSLTWPEYLAGVCRIDGRLTRMSYKEDDVLLALLLRDPDRFVKLGDLIESVWPNPDTQPLGAKDTLWVLIHRRLYTLHTHPNEVDTAP